jgi:hypothetical protein
MARFKGLTPEQLRRIKELRTHLAGCAEPLGDLNALRYMFDELLAILLEQPGETSKACPHGHKNWDECPVCGH